ncbi:MAG: bifunctional chorismate mutase/prephenate dehydratase [Oscillospiraceae bacterium]|nr:bifunctional chorismate mutase/prephenate dehydratase [Oscillospiraceae bacterium]
MDELQDLRREIDAIDRELVELFRRRMDVTARVGAYKRSRGVPVLDQERERQVLQNKGELAGEALRPAVITLYQTIMALSRRQQRDLMGQGADNPGVLRWREAQLNARSPVAAPRVVYQGEPGAYSEQAALDLFGERAGTAGLEQFEDCFLALREGRADYAVLPIENSSTGAIRQIYDLLTQYECYVVGETAVKVEHCLMALPGAALDSITHVYSHEQGLFQCERYLNAHPDWKQVPQADTAGSAKMVADSGDLTKAAICSARAAQLYGLEILARGINHNAHNTTRFVVVSPKLELRPGADKISTLFVLPHQAGSLHEVLTVFAVHGLNMVKLESRPLPGRSWQYMFFLEFTGAPGDPAVGDALHELAQTTGEFRVLGWFPSNLE